MQQRLRLPFITSRLMLDNFSIADHIQALKLSADPQGYCMALSEMFMLAGLCSDISSFNTRNFELKNQHPYLLSKDIQFAKDAWQEQVAGVRELKLTLEQESAALLVLWNSNLYFQSQISIEIFLSCVSMLQCRQTQHHFVGGYHLSIPKMEKNILPMILPDRIQAEGGLERVNSFKQSFSIYEFMMLIKYLYIAFKDSNINVAIRFYSSVHQSALVYNYAFEEWHYYDSSYVCSKVFTDMQMLASEIYSKHSKQDHIVIGIDILTTALHAEKARECMDGLTLTSFDKLLTLTREKASVVDHNNASLLFLACMTGDSDTVAQLIRLGANLNLQLVSSGSTALRLAVEYAEVRCVDLLLTAKADYQLATINGETPLHTALRVRNEIIFFTLLEAGASPYFNNSSGESVLMIARKLDDTKYVEMIYDKYEIMNPAKAKLAAVAKSKAEKRERDGVGLFNEASARPVRQAKLKAKERFLYGDHEYHPSGFQGKK